MENAAFMKHTAALVKQIRFAMFTTELPNGELTSRPMTTQKIDAERSKVFFLAPKDSHACRDTVLNPHVNLAYSDPEKSAYVSITGHAQVVYDPSLIERLWGPMNEAWFPEGPSDPTIRVITVDIVKAEYWETKESKITQLFSFAKALITGETPKIGEHQASTASVEFNPA